VIDIYIYYKVDAAHRELALGGARAVIDLMAAEVGVTGALGQRADDPLTWLETYRGVTDEPHFHAAMDKALNISGLLKCLAGERHVERFVACA
jgi:hypothetical protein